MQKLIDDSISAGVFVRIHEKAMIDSSTLKAFKQGLVKGLGFGTGISIALATTTLIAAAAAMKIFSAGEVISATELNRNFTIAAPEGAVMAFNLAGCPEGWAPADGQAGRPDLRGRFVRGLNDFGTGAGAVSIDPAGIRAVGSLQTDAFQGHRFLTSFATNNPSIYFYGLQSPPPFSPTHGLVAWSKWGDPAQGTQDIEFGYQGYSSTPQAASNGSPRTADETRPVNIGLIYCVRTN